MAAAFIFMYVTNKGVLDNLEPDASIDSQEQPNRGRRCTPCLLSEDKWGACHIRFFVYDIMGIRHEIIY